MRKFISKSLIIGNLVEVAAMSVTITSLSAHKFTITIDFFHGTRAEDYTWISTRYNSY